MHRSLGTLLIVILSFCINSISAANTNQLVNLINQGEYERALLYAKDIRVWINVPQGSIVLDLDSAIRFTELSKAYNSLRNERKKIRLFLADVCMEQGQVLSKNDRWSDDACLNFLFAEYTRRGILGNEDPSALQAFRASSYTRKSVFSYLGTPLPNEGFLLKEISIMKACNRSKKDIAIRYRILCMLENKLKEYGKAVIYGQQAYDLFTSLPHGGVGELEDIVTQLAWAYYQTKDYENAEKYYIVLLKNFYKAFTRGDQENEKSYHKDLYRLAYSQYKQKKYAEAVDNFVKVRDYRKTTLGAENESYISVTEKIGYCYYYQKKYKSAIPYLKEVVTYNDKNNIQDNNAIDIERKLAISYYKTYKYKSSIPYFKKVVEYYRSNNSKNDNYIDALYWLGSAYYYNKQYSKAIENLEPVESYYAQNKDKSVSSYAHILKILGDSYLKRYKYAQAELTYTKIISNLKVANQTSDEIYAIAKKKLADSYKNQGKTAEALVTYKEALTLLYKLPNTDCEEIIDAHLSAAGLYESAGDYAHTEKNYLDALNLACNEQCKSKELSLIYNNLYVLYSNLGDYDRANKLLRNATRSMEKEGRENDPLYCTLLNNIGNLYIEQGKNEKAKQALERALEVAHKQKDNESIPYIYSNFGLLNVNNDKGEQYFKEAIDSLSVSEISQAIDKISFISNLIDYYIGRDQTDKAMPYIQQIEDIISTYHLEDNPQSARVYSTIANLYNKSKDFAKALTYTEKMLSLVKNQFANAVDFMSEQQRESLWNEMNNKFVMGNIICHNAYFSLITHAAEVAYDAELFKKGILLSSANLINQSILSSGNEQLINQWHYLKGLKSDLQDNTLDSKQKEEITQEIEKTEKEIIAKSADYRQSRKMANLTWKDVQRNLNKNEIAIEFMEVRGRGDTCTYCALVICPKESSPLLIPLFTSVELQPLLEQGQTNPNILYSYEEKGQQVSEYIWKALKPYIKKSKTIYFAPSGLLHQLAIETLPYSKNKTYGDVFNLVRLTSTRETVFRNKELKYNNAVLYGGIDYSIGISEMEKNSSIYNTETMFAVRGLDSDSTNRGSIAFLDSTLSEVNTISEILKNKFIHTTTYSGSEANEESFKALSGTHPDIIHIATHGFYWSDSIAKRTKYITNRRDYNTNTIIAPMRRCGLLFAGSSLAYMGYGAQLPSNVQDGILTAQEISILNFKGVNLVALSACETGVGDITGEGVYGLQRALKIAGVQTIIMSLWQVEDAATKMIMTEFYEQWQIKKKTKREAFKIAQKRVRKYYPNPRSWAAFVILD